MLIVIILNRSKDTKLTSFATILSDFAINSLILNKLKLIIGLGTTIQNKNTLIIINCLVRLYQKY
jgi:hypothetical protein